MWDGCLTGPDDVCVRACVCLCAYSCPSSAFKRYTSGPSHARTRYRGVVLPSLLWSNICDFFTAFHPWRQVRIDIYQYVISESWKSSIRSPKGTSFECILHTDERWGIRQRIVSNFQQRWADWMESWKQREKVNLKCMHPSDTDGKGWKKL